MILYHRNDVALSEHLLAPNPLDEAVFTGFKYKDI